MPHLAEKMKRPTKNEAALKQFERTPDLDANSRIKPLPREPMPPPTTNISTPNSMDEFLSSLSDEEAQYLARRRAQMLSRAAKLAFAQRSAPALPTSSRNINAYLTSLSDEEALVLARRREQELLELQRKLRQERQMEATNTSRSCSSSPTSSTKRQGLFSKLYRQCRSNNLD